MSDEGSDPATPHSSACLRDKHFTMYGQARLKNGRFVKAKVLIQKQKMLEGVKKRAEKSRQVIENAKNLECNNICEGNRIVNLKRLGDSLVCCKCKEILSLKNITAETREGLNSILKIDCIKCGITNVVCTSDKIDYNGHKLSDVNASVILGKLFAFILFHILALYLRLLETTLIFIIILILVT